MQAGDSNSRAINTAGDGSISRVVFAAGATDIFEMSAGVGTGDVQFASIIKALCTEKFTGVQVSGRSLLPAVPRAPAWLTTAAPAVNQWVSIPGTSGAGGAAVDAFSGVTVVGTQIVAALAGGHATTLDNRVVSIDLNDDAPAWVTRKAASTSTTNDTAYYPDGQPSSRHVYHAIHSIGGGKVLMGGCRFTFNGALDINTVDVFDLNTNTWEGVVPGSPGTSGSGWPNLTPSGYYLYAKDGDGNLWAFLHTNGNVAKFTVATKTWSAPTITGQVSPSVRYPWAWDSTREQLFGLCWADGEGFGSGMRAVRQIGTTQTAITFNASAAYTDWLADVAEYASMVYDPDNDRFLFYEGYASRAGRVYTITPNSGTTWDMGILATTGATVAATFGTKGSNHTGVQNRFQRVEFGAIKGFVVLPRASSNLFFLRTA